MKQFILLLTSVVFVSLIFSSCKRIEPIEDVPENGITEMEDMQVTSSFDWKTSTDYTLTLEGNSSNIVEITSEEGTPYLKVFIKANESYSTKLTVPTYEEKVILKYMGKEVSLDLNSSELSYKFE